MGEFLDVEVPTKRCSGAALFRGGFPARRRRWLNVSVAHSAEHWENGTDAQDAFAKPRDAARDYACHYIREWDYDELFEHTRAWRPYEDRISRTRGNDELTGVWLNQEGK